MADGFVPPRPRDDLDPVHAVTERQCRETLGEVLRAATDDHAPTIVTREDGEAAVVMSLADYRSLRETLFLLSSKKNAQRLFDAIAEDRAGGGTARELLE